jgi:dipeptidyl aminopeptidase/acylaminoacyl peptidase
MRCLFAATALALAASPALADDLAARFATRAAAMRVALSPDGDKIVYVGAYKTGGRAVTVADLKTGETRTILAGAELGVTPRSCAFKTETRLICTLYGVFDKTSNFSRLMAVIDGKNRRLVGSHADTGRYGGEIIDWLPDDPDHVLIASAGVIKIDINNGRPITVESGSEQTMEFGADNHGNIRFRGLTEHDPDGYLRDTGNYSFRPLGSKEWQPLLHVALSDQRAPEAAGFDEKGDHIFVLLPLDGRQALYSVATDANKTRTLVYSNPEVDVDGVLRIGKYRRPVAATYTVERSEVHYFDPKLAVLSASLSKALPGHPDVSIRDESWDGMKKLVYVDGDSRPGRYYLYDDATRKLSELLAVYPALDEVPLGTVKPIRYAARDGTMIPGYLTLPPGKTDARGLPGLVMPHGGPSARDTTGFDWLAQFFAAQGFAVLQPNFRGSSGYGEAFFAKNGFQSWRLAIGDVNDGARWLVTQGIDAKKLEIFGWSYGGYAALQANVAEPDLYRATVAVAPVTDLALLRYRAQHFANYKMMTAMIGSGEHVLSGSPARNATKFTAPVMIFHADKDLNVDIEQSRTMVSALRGAGKKVDFVEYKGLDHQIDDSAAREDMLSKSAAFLKAAMN